MKPLNKNLLRISVFWALGMVARRQWLHRTLVLMFPLGLAVKVVTEVIGVT